VSRESTGEPNRILVVDDERAITDLVAMALKYEGFSVQTAGTAKNARHAVMDFRPDLMILDVGLPDDDGFTLVQRLITDGVKVPVIFLTARDAT
jgi:two-component system, OmpR family, response regulator